MWSFSRLDALLNGCPRRYKLAYIDRVKPERVPSLFEEGNKMHDLIQDYLRGINVELGNLKLRIELDAWLAWADEVEIEKYFSFEDLIEGYADIVFSSGEEVVVLDIKTRYNNELTKRDRIQLSLYAHVLGANKVGIIVPYNQYEPLNVVELVEVDAFPNFPKDFYKVIEKAEEMYEKYEKTGWKPNFIGCEVCEYALSCRGENLGEIEGIAQELRLLEIRAEELRNRLKAYCETTGKGIMVGDVEYGFFEKFQNVLPDEREALVHALLEQGRIDLLRPDVWKIKKDEQYKHLVKEKVVYEFGSKRRKEG